MEKSLSYLGVLLPLLEHLVENKVVVLESDDDAGEVFNEKDCRDQIDLAIRGMEGSLETLRAKKVESDQMSERLTRFAFEALGRLAETFGRYTES